MKFISLLFMYFYIVYTIRFYLSLSSDLSENHRPPWNLTTEYETRGDKVALSLPRRNYLILSTEERRNSRKRRKKTAAQVSERGTRVANLAGPPSFL